MKLAIVGSRTFNNYEKLKEILLKVKGKIEYIVSGGAKGADSLGERYAKENNIPTIIFKPDWDKYGKRAGFIRNELIIKEADNIIAFWDGKSKGTKSSIDLCKKYNKKFHIVYF